MPHKTRDVMSRLEKEGWTGEHGKGDHRNYRKPGHGVITIDTGEKEVKKGLYGRIAKLAGWK
ncbi:MAG: type II toxin-antitoxin system HicA family toxin [Coriobacteriales bacterium]|jgi:predicted RNA binding protein YcfA (HicA-like mRNA interferase family)|nr:type II toxin-antitoxin system HicA family toxin [Coriobacteriales bacterium]